MTSNISDKTRNEAILVCAIKASNKPGRWLALDYLTTDDDVYGLVWQVYINHLSKIADMTHAEAWGELECLLREGWDF